MNEKQQKTYILYKKKSYNLSKKSQQRFLFIDVFYKVSSITKINHDDLTNQEQFLQGAISFFKWPKPLKSLKTNG